MRRIKHVLNESFMQEEVVRTARAQTCLRRWVEVVGEGLAKRSWPDRYDRGTVWVAVEGSSWAQELRMLKSQILEKLTAMSGERGLFKDVRFGVRKLYQHEALAPEEAPSPPSEDDREGLSIREIYERRVARMEAAPEKPLEGPD
ncbi:MAG: DUF721 domain-containing protein [Fimbriimonadaceae bacterium]|nr:DUF721 domain-containing protein [Fimbriimonadaceae bacterium]